MSLPYLRTRTPRRCAVAGATIVALAAVNGCAGGVGAGAGPGPTPAPASSAAASSTASDRLPVVCSAWVDSDAAAASVLLHSDLASAPREQVQSVVKFFWSRQEPILTSMQPAPDQIAPDVDKLLALARQGASTGDVATLSSPELQDVDRNIDQYMLQHCGYQQMQVTATDTAYQGLPATVRAGTIGITLTNQGTEAHQVVLSRANDGVSEPFAEILNLPPEQQGQMATPLGFTDAGPGGSSTVFLRLAPGRYGAIDFLPAGTTNLAAPGSGPPHYQLGVQGEFTVT